MNRSKITLKQHLLNNGFIEAQRGLASRIFQSNIAINLKESGKTKADAEASVDAFFEAKDIDKNDDGSYGTGWFAIKIHYSQEGDNLFIKT